MARTIRTKVYQFNELNENAKQKAIELLCDINVNYDWWSSTYEDAANIGLKLTSFDLDKGRGANGEFTLAANEVAVNIFRDHGNMCETYKTAESFMNDWQPVFNNYMDENHKDYENGESESKLMELENEFLHSLLEDYSIILQNEYEYLQSDKAIQETIEANEYEFTEDGRRF
jgi:hypothetical protein